MSSQIPVILLMGPTAAGKTDLAIRLVEEMDCDIISVDSAMVYKGMDIGTAKPDEATLAKAPHRLIDILDPAEIYSAARFRQDALREIEDVLAGGHRPLLAGGTMLYYKALVEGLAELPDADPVVRERITIQANEEGWAALHQRLVDVDPEAGARIHPNDPQRIQRALEVYETSGVSMSELLKRQSGPELNYRWINLVVAPTERSVLHERIAKRFHQMIDQGFIEEVEALKARGDLDLDRPSMRAVGYRQVWEYLEGKLSREEMIERGIIATRQLAKRQFTWLRSLPEAAWFDPGESDFYQKVLNFLRGHTIY